MHLSMIPQCETLGCICGIGSSHVIKHETMSFEVACGTKRRQDGSSSRCEGPALQEASRDCGSYKKHAYFPADINSDLLFRSQFQLLWFSDSLCILAPSLALWPLQPPRLLLLPSVTRMPTQALRPISLRATSRMWSFWRWRIAP